MPTQSFRANPGPGWRSCRPRIRFSLGGRAFEVAGTPSQINRFVFASGSPAAKRAELDAVAADAIVAGHCGVPFTQPIGGRLWHNAGVIGMPANDGRRETWASLLAPAAGGVEVRLLPLAYDGAKAAAKMRARGLPEDYAASLETGLWPNCDILPAAEAAQRGRPIPVSHSSGARMRRPREKPWPGSPFRVEPRAYPA